MSIQLTATTAVSVRECIVFLATEEGEDFRPNVEREDADAPVTQGEMRANPAVLLAVREHIFARKPAEEKVVERKPSKSTPATFAIIVAGALILSEILDKPVAANREALMRRWTDELEFEGVDFPTETSSGRALLCEKTARAQGLLVTLKHDSDSSVTMDVPASSVGALGELLVRVQIPRSVSEVLAAMAPNTTDDSETVDPETGEVIEG